MKLKQVLFIVAISAGSAVGSVAIFNKVTRDDSVHIGSAQKGYPANYAGYFDGKPVTTADAVDFTKAANTAVPAVVHIKTKIPAKKISNDLPRRRSIFDDVFGEHRGAGLL
jgi:serine protease Do